MSILIAVAILGTSIIIALLFSAYRDMARFQYWIDSGMPEAEEKECL